MHNSNYYSTCKLEHMLTDVMISIRGIEYRSEIEVWADKIITSNIKIYVLI